MTPTLTFSELRDYLKCGEEATRRFILRNDLERLGKTYNRFEVDIALECEAYERKTERLEKIRRLKVGGRQEIPPGVEDVTGGSGSETIFTVAIPGATKERRKRA